MQVDMPVPCVSGYEVLISRLQLRHGVALGLSAHAKLLELDLSRPRFGSPVDRIA